MGKEKLFFFLAAKKKKLTILFALLCASMMSWAYDLAPNTNFGSQDLQWQEIDGVTPPANVVNVQSHEGHDCLYITFSDAGFNRDYIGGGAVVYTNDGAQAWLQLESFTNQYTDVLFYQTGSTTDVKWGLRIYNAAAGAVDSNVPHASGKGFGTYIAKDVPFYALVDNKADETQSPMGSADLYIVTYGNKMMAKAKLNGGATFQGNGYSMQFRIWNDAQTGFGEYWAQLRAENNTIALIDMNSNYCNLNQGVRTELPFNTYMETSAGTGAVPMFTYTLDYINTPIVGDETAPVISSAVASYSPITGEPTITITATDANDIFYKIVDPSNNISYSFSNTILLTTDGSNNVLTYTVYAIDYNGNVSSAENVNVQMKPALSNIALNKSVTAGVNQSKAGYIVDGNFDGDRWSSAGAIHYNPTTHPDDYQDWFYINFVNIYDLSAVRIKWETARPNNYTFRTSIDGTNWTTVASFTEYPTANAIVDYVLPANTQGRFFGVWATSGYKNLNYGISPFEVEVYGAQAVIEDHNPPTLHSAVLSGDPEWNQVRIAVDAEDAEDPVIYVYHVVDATHSIDQECMVSEGIITVTGLSGETTYNLSVKAVDGAGNESDAIVVNATTPMDTSIPLVAAPAPDATGKDVLPVYSDAFASILAHPFDKDGWGGVPLMEEKNISGDNCLIYNVASANEVIWGMYDDGNSAIIAADGYHSADGKGVDASAMTNLHIDIWSLQPCTNAINICINDAALKTLRLSHDGTGWNSYDIALSEFNEGAEGKRIDNVRWFKFNGIGPISGKMALDNVYFWAPASGMKSVSASSNNATMGSAVVKQNDVEVTSVAENSDATFIATVADPALYRFVNWTKGGVEVSTAATYVATITETTNLVANFDYIRNAYCHTEILTNNNKKLYLSISKVADNTYRIRIDGSAEARINGRNNFNFTINHTNDYSNEPYADGHGWQVNNEGYGYIENTFTANDYKALTFGSHYFAIGAQGVGEFILDNNFPAATSIDWDATCSDTEAPAFNKAEAEVLNESSVRLKIQATDNWGGLLTYTIAREAAEPIISNHASGEEFTQDVTGLTAGMEYTFTVTVSDGVNSSSQNIAVTPVADNIKPVMTSASLESKTWNSAIINVTATDNKGVTAYRVVNADPVIDAEYVAEDGKITVEGLTANTAYSFTITAKDAAGNESANSKSVVFTTNSHDVVPTTAAPVPTWPANQVKSLYSNKYTFAPASLNSYNEGWHIPPTMVEENIGGDNYLRYHTNMTGIVGWQFGQISVATMEYIHVDIWPSEDGTITMGPTSADPTQVAGVTLNVVAGQWNSFDISIAELQAANASFDVAKVFQNQFTGYSAQTTFSVDNVYFYRTTPPPADETAPTDVVANKTEENFASVKLSAQANDDSGVVHFKVMNGTSELVSDVEAVSGATVTIMVNGLTPNTNYTLSVVAFDEAGHEAEPVNVAVKTKALPSAAPQPAHDAVAVLSVYSDAYEPAVAAGFRRTNWGSAPVAIEDDYILYTMSANTIVWGNSDGNAGYGNIDGLSGYTHDATPGLDVSGMTYIHFDVWCDAADQLNTVNINDVAVTIPTTRTIAGEWVSFDVDITGVALAERQNVRWLKFHPFNAANCNAAIDNVYFWKEPDYTRDDSWMAPGELGTVCYPEGLVVTGATMYQMAGTDANGKFVFDEVDVLAPGVPYLFEAHANALHFYATTATPATEAGTSNGMVGTFADKVIPQNSPNIYYFSGTKFYAVTARSTDLDVPANRAYVDLTTPHPAGAPRAGVRRVVFDVQGSNAATGFGEVQGDEQQSTKVLINGHLFIRRGEKTYDATGRLVK